MITSRQNSRLKNYDYHSSGWYFITICTKNHQYYFGQINQGEIILNTLGKIVKAQWLFLRKQYFYILLDEFIIMPNHFHVILIIENCTDRSRPVPTVKIKSLSELIGVFKTTSSKIIHQQTKCFHFSWQRSFYDHVIRNDESLYMIREYIKNNPVKWESDRYNLTSDLKLYGRTRQLSIASEKE